MATIQQQYCTTPTCPMASKSHTTISLRTFCCIALFVWIISLYVSTQTEASEFVALAYCSTSIRIREPTRSWLPVRVHVFFRSNSAAFAQAKAIEECDRKATASGVVTDRCCELAESVVGIGPAPLVRCLSVVHSFDDLRPSSYHAAGSDRNSSQTEALRVCESVKAMQARPAGSCRLVETTCL